MRIVFFMAFLPLAAILFNGCEKENDLGKKLIEGIDQTAFSSDTLSFTCETQQSTSIRTDELGSAFLGFTNDSLTGKYISDIASQLSLSTTDSIHGTPISADSLVLHLAVSGFIGDSTQSVSLIAKRLTERIYADSIYYSDRKAMHMSVQEGIASTLPKSSVKTIRIPLSMQLANEIVSKAGTSVFRSNEAFHSFFNGLYLTSDSTNGKGGMLRINLKNSGSRLSLYYKTDSARRYDFGFSAWYAGFRHTFTQEVTQSLQDTSKGAFKAYLASMAGLRVRIIANIPETLKSKGPVAINQAEIKVFLAGNTKHPPSRLIISRIDNNSVNFADYNTASQSYSFNIPGYLQNILDGKNKDQGFYLMMDPLESVSDIKSAVIGGGRAGSGKKLHMKVIYTQL
jgi:hypothetical protein